MVFSGIPFLYYFLPAVILLYFLMPKGLKNGFLLLASLVFYGCGEPKLLWLMVASIVLAYFYALMIERAKGQAGAKIWLIIGLATSIGFLALFKYADFFAESFNALTGLGLPLLKLALPIGISFYSFQIMSYLIDVYRDDTKAQKNIVDFGAYVALFPQLIAGPIVRYTDIEKELKNRTTTFDDFYCGVRRFIIGLGKKVLLANLLSEFCDIFRSSAGGDSVLFFWLYALCFTLYIYFDFSAYSDMAIGLGRIFGFKFPENFNYPYISRSISEFWRRWHMTLGSWFREYVYIPLGGNLVKPARWAFNLFVVWMLTGLWHGAAWNFVIWGLLFGVFLCVEKLWLGKYLEKWPRILQSIYVMVPVVLSFVIFNAADFNQLAGDFAGLFGAAGLPAVSASALYYLRSYIVIIILGILGCTPLPKFIVSKLAEKKWFETIRPLVEPLFLLAVLLLSTAYLVDGSFNPFLYFRF